MTDGEAAGAAARPVGLDAVHKACSEVYPDQPNPLQVTALVKHWLGGPDPLDYISMFGNHGNIAAGIPPHWHYVSFGLSDLHGDRRVHARSEPGHPSGFGFELTFRLKREKGENTPPTWPAELMQALSRYVFKSENVLCVGDHISWHTPLDRGDSTIQHMLLAPDAQLSRVNSALGYVNFIQIVGITSEELGAAQRWNGPGVLDLLRKYSVTGGEWLVTNMRRGESVFDIDISNQVCVEEGVEREGSSLSGVSAVCLWEGPGGRPCSTHPPIETVKAIPSEGELLQTETLQQVHIKLNQEAAKLLPLAIKGRLRHGRHFTFKSFTGEQAVTLVCHGVQGTFADSEHPLACQGPWLQVFVTEEFMAVILRDLEGVLEQKKPLPRKLEWSNQKLAVSILPNE